MASKTKKNKENKLDWMIAFEKATSLTVTIVFFPVLFLLLGVWVDKKMETTPLFIILGMVIGIILGVHTFIKEGRKLRSNG